jgi:hypothetical protein
MLTLSRNTASSLVVSQLTNVVLYNQKIVSHIFLVHRVDCFSGVFRSLEINIAKVKEHALVGMVLLDNSCQYFAELAEHLAKTIVISALGQVLNKNICVDFRDILNSALIFAFVEHHL